MVRSFIHSFIFMPAFPMGRAAVTAALGHNKTHGQQNLAIKPF